MGNICINIGGGGGITSDDVTTTRDNVLTGFKTLMKDSNDEPVEGTIPVYHGNVKAEAVYLDDNQVTFSSPYGYSRFLEDSEDMRTYRTYGELAGALGLTASKVAFNNTVLGVAGTYKGLGNATAAQVLSGYTFSSSNISNGTGTLSISSVVSFRAAQYSNLTLIASWALPSRGPWSGIRVVCKQGGYPSNANDGTLFYEGSGTSAYKTLAAGVWYFTAWNYITTNIGRLYGSYVQASANNTVVHGQQVFTSSGTFTVPTGITSIDLFGVGGGCGGHAYRTNADESDGIAGGGGGGYTTTVRNLSVAPGQVLNINIGAGGAGGIVPSRKPWDPLKASSGGSTTISRNGAELLTAAGGQSYAPWGINAPSTIYGSNGGSGGGGGGRSITAHGGSDGSDGQGAASYVGKGQHTTTRAFAESSNTLYAGGGGCGAQSRSGGNGGAGGGGNGQSYSNYGTAGVAGTGGGGGGGVNASGSPGGGGIVIIRW